LGTAPGTARAPGSFDPIDGTRNFVLGLLHWGTMIALNDGAQPVLGAVHQPFVDESFIGCVSGRAQWLRGGRSCALRTRRCASLSGAFVSVSDPQTFRSDREMAVLNKVMRAAHDVRYGVECYGACLLACGEIDIVLDAGLDTHDVQPLIPIIEAAGGVMTDWEGRPCYDGGAVLACGDPALHARLLQLIT
jgi:myo-inositol-1(or 4)-monophosphatase